MSDETRDEWLTLLSAVATTALTVALVAAVGAGLMVGSLHLAQWVRDQ